MTFFKIEKKQAGSTHSTHVLIIFMAVGLMALKLKTRRRKLTFLGIGTGTRRSLLWAKQKQIHYDQRINEGLSKRQTMLFTAMYV